MKKLIRLLSVLLAVACLTACASKSESGIPSPMKEISSLEKLSKKADCALIRPENISVENEAYHMISGDPEIAQYSFTVDGTDCFLRFADADISTDISGLYSQNGPLFADSEVETTYIENSDLKAQRWFTVDGQYIFAVLDSGTWAWEDFDSICTQFRKMEPKNWKSKVPFADYQALEGNYEREAGGVYGAINIRYGHAGLYVLAVQEDGSRLYWEMEAVLEGDRLVYEKETISSIVFDEQSGGTVTTELADGGAGYVEVKDGSLVFANACSPQLKDLILVPSQE